MNRLAKENLLGSLSKVGLPICVSCLSGTAKIKSFGKGLRATHPWDLVHSDVCETVDVNFVALLLTSLLLLTIVSRYGYVSLFITILKL